MKNLTVSLDEETHRLARMRAAAAGLSMSRYVAALVEQNLTAESVDTEAQRRARLAGLQRFFDGVKLQISENGKMPTAEARNARR